MLFHLLVLYTILVFTSSSSVAPSQAYCNRVCKRSDHETRVRYPFGFSNDCVIPLHCSDTGEVSIKGHRVINITSDHILISLPANCTRHVKQIHQLQTDNYALTRRNGLLLDNCNQSLNDDCVVSMSLIKGQFNLNLPRCKQSNRSLSCYSDDDNIYDGVEFMNLTGLEKARCRGLYSSFVVDLGLDHAHRSSVSMGFELVELGWWIEGNCGCHRKAVCTNVSIDYVRVGYRCHCVDGYDGDGFVEGDGCRRDSCPFCGDFAETVDHIFIACGLAQTTWSLVSQWCKVGAIFAFQFQDLLNLQSFVRGSATKKKVSYEVCLTTVWVLWKCRNEAVFEHKKCSFQKVTGDIKAFSYLWVKSRARKFSLEWEAWCQFDLQTFGQ